MFAMASLPARLIILPLLLLFGTCNANLIRGGDTPQKPFDFFVLALSWSGTSCSSVKDCCPTNACCSSEVATGFTINGFWPDYNNGSWPSCCDGPKYDQNSISIISGFLNTYWPSYDCISAPACGRFIESDLAFEWDTHGKCASPVLSNQYEYFSTALMLYFKYNITEILLKAGYVPSNTVKYPLKDITSAIKNALGVTPIVKCNGHSPIREIQICFDKTLQIEECPTYAPSKCPSRVKLPIKNVTQVPETTNYLSFRGSLNW
ncbi:PREDICTED: ribonuclease 2-like [Ipomoea nil]|uniref:ribonuclease 2-like n=1 Tax=Ipomoea nil TaxID=35883 RepID=UPI00090187E4|nr:PREDICTED: ribonuclease 2-like [Ipomoea nil]